MKTFNLKNKLLALSLGAALLLLCAQAKADALWVGQPKTCEVTIMGIFQTNVSWNVSGGYISLTGSTWATKTATITQYFNGQATITCTYQYKLYSNDQLRPFTQTWQITCIDNPLTIYPTSMALEPGQSEYVVPQLNYTNNYSQYASYLFTSIDPSVATVNSSGRVTAIADGITNIQVSSTASANSCLCIVRVTQSPTGVAIPELLSIEIGESVPLTPEVEPSGAAATFAWHSSDFSVASVSSDGVVTGVGYGSAVVTCVTQNGITSNDCEVTVDYRTPAGVGITEDTCYLLVGETHQLMCDVFPVGSNPSVVWHSCDEFIVPVNGSGLIAGYHLGATRVVATTINGLQDTCYVEVREAAGAVQLRYGVSIALGAQYEYHPSFIPENSYANDLQWESDDESIVTVDNGVIRAVGLGSTTIRVFNSQGLYAESTVYVKEMCQINVWLNSGVRYSFPIDYGPKISYTSEGRFYIEAWYLNASYDIADVNKVTIADEEEPWLEMPAPNVATENEAAFSASLSVCGDQLSLVNLVSNSPVCMCSIDGRMVYRQTADANGCVSINIGGYSAGIYIVRTNQQTFKIYIP